MNTVTHSLVDEYLRRLAHEARVLPRRDQRELVAEIRAHVDAALRTDASEADVRNVLDELGTPTEIVAAARPSPSGPTRGAREVFAVILLLFGGLVLPLVGWLAGVGLLLSSPLWSGRQKLLGILVWPGGLSPVLLVVLVRTRATESCVSVGSLKTCSGSGPSALAGAGIAALALVPPILVALYLYRAAGRHVQPA
jgi:hypothetical protein